MMFTKLIVENFGLFRGRHEFDLTTYEKPIVLFGGKNGSGKTTLLEAFKLCLYGKAFSEVPLSDTKYKTYLRSRVHRFAGMIIQPQDAFIQLEFKYVRLGKVDNYTVKRYWKITNENVNEYFEIYKNGKILEDIKDYQWQDFIKNLIPIGLARLFFFDGEKIQQLAEDKNNIHLKESFESLVGIDILVRLITDLNLLKSRFTKGKSLQLDEEEHKLENEMELLRRELQLLYDKRLEIQTELNDLLTVIDKLELKLANEGGGYAIKRENLKNERESLNLEIERIEYEIRKMMSDLLPFSLAKRYSLKLRERLISERKYLEENSAKNLIESKIPLLKEILMNCEWDVSNIDQPTKLLITNKIIEVIKEVFNIIPEDRVVHNLSFKDTDTLLQWIDTSLNLQERLKEYTTTLDNMLKKREEVERDIFHIPPDEAINPIIKELNLKYMQLGEKKEVLAQLEDNIRSLEWKVKENRRKIEDIRQKRLMLQKDQERIEMIEKVQSVLDEFIKRIKKEKISLFSKNLVESLNALSTKKDYQSININPDDFTVTIYKDRVVDKEELSAGEKQIYAISILWSLARTSGRTLPFIIDTPLARLDSEHRYNIINNLLPYLGHQIIIFSTDTEIDKEYFKQLSPYISHSYHIKYDKTKGMSEVTKGYFWEEEIVR